MRQCPRCSSRYDDAVGFCPRDGTGLEEIKDSLIGEEVGHYKISSLIGEGGMGAVYLAVHPGIGSRVAVKVLHPELARDRAAVDRFFSEARSVNLIHHENIVNILDLAQLSDGRSYIVMEYLEGESVAARLRKKGPFTPKEAVTLMLPVLGALQAAHEHGIIHRDLKPDNIFLTRGGQVKVLDFGIAKLDVAHGGGSATRTGAILGTPMYMSPEQAAGRASQVDHRSDVYSAGIILHELISGRVPFMSDALYDLITKHLTEPPTPLRQLKVDVPAELEAAVLRALAKERDARFPTAATMAEELQRVLDLIAARPAPAAAVLLPPPPGAPVAVPPTHSAGTPVPPTYTPTPAPVTPSGYAIPATTPPAGYGGPPVGYPAPPPTAPAFTPPAPPAGVPATTPFGAAPGAALPPTTPGLPSAALPTRNLGPAPYAPPARQSKGGVTVVVVLLVLGGLVAAYGLKLFPFQKGAAQEPSADAGAVAEPAQADAAAVVPIGSVDAGPAPGATVAVKERPAGGKTTATADKGHEAKATKDKGHEAKATKDKGAEKKEKPFKDVPLPRDIESIDDVYKRLGKQRPIVEKTSPAESTLSGLYSGRIHNTTIDKRTTGSLLLRVSGSSVSGYLTVHPPLGGSGPLAGSVKGSALNMTVRSPDGTIHLRGIVLGRTITGGYTVTGARFGGEQRGTFTMRRP